MAGNKALSDNQRKKLNLGVNEDEFSKVYLAQNGSPEQNTEKMIEMIGGIEKIVGQLDIVILKPNAQWWNQGMTNTDSMKALIESVLNIPDFQGEIIIAENHQYKELDGRGWTTHHRNGAFNFNELVEYFNQKGFNNVTKYQWKCAGPNPNPFQGDGCCGRRVKGPADGDGYVWEKDNVYRSPSGKLCYMTYPVFTSRYSGIVVDLKKGAWKDGRYLPQRPIKFINYSALNHHGWYSGVTASIKNLMGVVDMTCGFQGTEPKGTYNVHYIGVKQALIKLASHVPEPARYYIRKIAYKDFCYTGGALGKFMKTVRNPDLNIVTADWIGWGSRWDVKKSSYPKTILASRDPVALDYISAKEVLLKITPDHEEWFRDLNDPTIQDGPFFKFLSECHKQGIGNLDENNITKIEYDFKQAK